MRGICCQLFMQAAAQYIFFQVLIGQRVQNHGICSTDRPLL